MTTPCSHPDVVPVEVRNRTTGAVEVVAHVCTSCFAQLPANWGCTDCEWTPAPRRLCDPLNETPLVLARPCPTHQEETP